MNTAVYKELLTLSWPIIISRFGTFVLVLIDLLMVGGNGTFELASYASGNYFNTVFWILGVSFLTGVRVYVSHAIGEGDENKATLVLAEGLKLAIYSSIFLFILSVSSKYWLSMFGFEAEFSAVTGTVVLLLGLGLFGHLLYATISFYLEAIAKPNVSMWVIVVAIALNFLLNNLFIDYQWFSSPIIGVAVSTTIVRTLMCIAVFYYVFSVIKFNPWKLVASKAERKAVKSDLVGYGISSCISGSMTFVLASFAIIAGVKGVVEAAVFQVFINMAHFCANFTNGITAALSIKIGYLSKQVGSFAQMSRNIMAALIICLIMSCLFYTSFYLFDLQVAHLYSTSNDVVSLLISRVLALGFFFLLCDALVRIFSLTARGLGDRSFTTGITIFSYSLGIVVAYLQCIVFSWGTEWLLVDMMLSNLLIVIVLAWRFSHVFISPLMKQGKTKEELNI